MSGALDGIRVIDFGQYIAEPLVRQLLPYQGAGAFSILADTGLEHDLQRLVAEGVIATEGVPTI